jgi:hypothetical protein
LEELARQICLLVLDGKFSGINAGYFGVEARGLTVLELNTENTETLAAIALIAEDTGNTRHVRFSGTAKFRVLSAGLHDFGCQGW